jgi:WD40 repeat protein
MNARSRITTSVAWLALLLGCANEPDRRIAGALAADHAANFSEWSEPVSLGPTINMPGVNDQQATLSKDGLRLYFASARPEGPGDANPDLNLWVAHRACADDSCPWESPVSLGSAVNGPVNDFAPALSRDEHWLFFASPRQPGGFGSGDIWASYRDDTHDDFAWQPPINLGPAINTTGFQGGPSYFENEAGDGAQLYFNHNPAPVNSGGDIYVSTQAADGSWGAAVSVTELNSAASEQRPSIAHDGRTIYFFSDRPGSSSNDIWVSTRESVFSPWNTPVNVGPPISTAGDERHPFIYSHGTTEMLFFARNVATPPAVDLDIFVSTRTRGGNRP